ncbi:MAG TPA: type IV toxin-antitoxin system AbiEi family antitoxin domain-containing protein [Solirubrobacteraceae bacterium]|jgi:hypothetical protein|nr:type IV toxin-antitoxin system AbiEi family antitoxin domain-containing protein [Solirubrobacteraceae bacterium]
MRALFDQAAWLAARQHGRIGWAQLVELGVDRRRIQRWVGDGRLRRVHHGVYALGHTAPSLRGGYMAAVLACGPTAALSHRAAAHLLGLVRGAVPPPEVTVPTRAGRKRPGIVIHRARTVHRLDLATFDDIPVTIVPRILLDIAPTTEPTQLTRACHEAWVRHGTTPRHVEACIARNPTKPGARRLRTALGREVTLSELEDGFLALLREHALPAPQTNVSRHGDKVDCHWPQLDLTIELHSFRYHATRAAFETDLARRRRSRHLAFSYGDVFERPADTIAEILRAMRAAAAR